MLNILITSDFGQIVHNFWDIHKFLWEKGDLNTVQAAGNVTLSAPDLSAPDLSAPDLSAPSVKICIKMRNDLFSADLLCFNIPFATNCVD